MGKIITFYSFKGGTGRSMALSNVAVLLSRQTSGRILMLDWDLEAPGLEDYFRPFLPDLDGKAGILDWVETAQKALPKIPYREASTPELTALNQHFEQIESLQIPISLSGSTAQLFLLRSGNREKNYASRISRFSWSKLYNKIPEFFPEFARWLSKRYDYILIDSRTGHSDTGGICTVSMPDKLVLVFTPNEQSLSGVIQTAHAAADYRMNYDGTRPLSIYPLPSRIDFNGVSQAKRENWQNGYRLRWEKAFRDIYALPPTISLKSYFDKVYVRHDSNFAFGEELAVLSNDTTPECIQRDYERLVTHLAFDEIWENQPFAGMEKPFEVFFAFSEQDREKVKQFTKHLQALKRDNILNWNESLMIPMEHWDTDVQQKTGAGRADIILVFDSPHLKEQSENMKLVLTGSDKTSVYSIALTPNSGSESIEPLIRRKTLSDWSSPDEAWSDMAKQLKYQLSKLNRTRLTQSA